MLAFIKQWTSGPYKDHPQVKSAVKTVEDYLHSADSSHKDHEHWRVGLTPLNKILLAACVVLALAVIYLSREQVAPAGPRELWTMVRNPWTGTVWLCQPFGGECRQTYPPIGATDK